MDFDYGVIGGGPAGYSVAMKLAQKGFKVVLFEKEKLGGTCLNKGCIPTKALLHASEQYAKCLNSNEIGLDIEVKGFDFSKIAEKLDKTVEKIRKSLELAVKNSGVITIYAEAIVQDKNTILADCNTYRVENIICATGAKPRELKGLEFDGEFVLSSDDVLKLNSLPKSVLIVGSGAIGIEWARIFSNFGVEVTLVELATHLIPLADIEVSKRVERVFKQNKIKFYLTDCIDSIDNKKVTLKSGVVIEPDFILSAVGRTPENDGWNSITKIGDVSGEIQLAHYAISQAINYCYNRPLTLDRNLIPSVIYGEPEIAWVGLKEQDCDDSYTKLMLPITSLGKSWCDDATDGFIKLILKDGYIVGGHIVSKEASALIHQVLMAIQYKISVEELKQMCFAHPTYSEGIFELLSRV